jgi:hypothetical protein
VVDGTDLTITAGTGAWCVIIDGKNGEGDEREEHACGSA